MLALVAAGRRLAEAAERTLDVGLATTAAVIVNRIRFLADWQPDWPVAADCGMATAAITRTALAAPKRHGHESLAHRAAHLLTDAVRINPERHGPLTARFGDPAVNEVTCPSPSRLIEVFGDRRTDLEGARGNIGTAFPAILNQDPPAAIELYLRVIEAAAPAPADSIETACLVPGLRPYPLTCCFPDQRPG
jgi:hypothetical protein